MDTIEEAPVELPSTLEPVAFDEPVSELVPMEVHGTPPLCVRRTTAFASASA